jgi:hypothetical protein
MEKSISEIVQPHFYGKPKFQYIVKRESYEVYRCTSVMKDQEDVLNTLIDRYKADSGVIRIYCNGNEIKVLNRLKLGRKPKYHWSNPK